MNGFGKLAAGIPTGASSGRHFLFAIAPREQALAARSGTAGKKLGVSSNSGPWNYQLWGAVQ